MYNILMIDDEPAILESLSNVIPWEEYGFETIVQAGSSAEGLSLMSKQPFDILITDIQMPHMTGLELIQNVRKQYPATRCIVLTAYSEFNYVLEALRLGVDNFLLKPINPQELSSTIQHSLEFIDKNHFAGSNDQNFQKNVLYRWITGDLSGNELDVRARVCNINLFQRHYDIVMVKKPLKDNVSDMAAANIRLLLSRQFDCYELSMEEGHLFILGGHMITSALLAELINEEASHLTSGCVLIGQPVSGSSKISFCYSQLEEFSLLADLWNQKLILFEEVREKLNTKLSAMKCTDIVRELKRQTPENISVDFLKTILPLSGGKASDMRIDILAFFSSLFRELEKNHIPKEALTHYKQRAVSLIVPSDRTPVLQEKLTLILSDARRLIFNEFGSVSPIISQAIEYVQKNLEQKITINSIAFQFSANPTYLGYLFKKETGLYFSDFLNRTRMEKAETLLLHTGYTVNEIAKMVGYSNASYFSQIFKKTYLISPAKFRQTQT